MMNPLLSNGELNEKDTQQKTEEMANLAIRKTCHNQTKRVAKKHTKNIVQGLHIETNGNGEISNMDSDKARDCGTVHTNET
jgi:hypothetical protein